MELINVGITFADFVWPFLITSIIVFLLGLLMSDGEDTFLSAILAIVIGALIGAVGVGAALDNKRADIQEEFSLAYNVVIIDGKLPVNPNEIGAVVLFTQNTGREICAVSTDDTHYTVVCDGAKLRPVK